MDNVFTRQNELIERSGMGLLPGIALAFVVALIMIAALAFGSWWAVGIGLAGSIGGGIAVAWVVFHTVLSDDEIETPLVRHMGVSDELGAWLEGASDHSLGSLVTLFGKRAFAVLFTVLLAVPAIPAPTGGVTHVFEVIAVLLAIELVVGREEVWLPQRWRAIHVDAGGRLAKGLLRANRLLERWTRPRMRFLFGHRLTNVAFGLLVTLGSLGAFLAPPFSGLDTLPAMGVVVLSLGVLAEDARAVVVGVGVMAAGIALELAVAGAVLDAIDAAFY